MSIKNWPGGRISKTPPTPAGPYQDGAASGVWTLDQVAYWTKQGLWPIAGNVNARGVFAGGLFSGSNVIQYITISNLGNAVDFGDLQFNTSAPTGCASSTRGLFAGGFSGGVYFNTINYITIASIGNAVGFGDLTVGRSYLASCSSNIRGLFGGGGNSVGNENTIDYVTIATTGNALDFGDLLQAKSELSSCSSPTRGIFSGSNLAPKNTIEFVTISSTGNATDFGDLSQGVNGTASCSSSVRGLIAGGSTTGGAAGLVLNIDYITISSTGDAINFGNLTQRRYYFASCSSNIRGVFGGGATTSDVLVNTIDYVTIASTGNATDFGDLIVTNCGTAACSNAHGGL